MGFFSSWAVIRAPPRSNPLYCCSATAGAAHARRATATAFMRRCSLIGFRLHSVRRLTVRRARLISYAVARGDRDGRRRPAVGRKRMSKPRIFLGSSGKQAKLLQALTRGLEDVAHVEPWTTSFNPGTTTLERLLELSRPLIVSRLLNPGATQRASTATFLAVRRSPRVIPHAPPQCALAEPHRQDTGLRPRRSMPMASVPQSGMAQRPGVRCRAHPWRDSVRQGDIAQ